MKSVIAFRRPFAILMMVLMLFSTVGVAHAQASGAGAGVPPAAVSTDEILTVEQVKVDRVQLLSMLETQEVQDRLAAMGVDASQIEDRVNNLTPQELAEFNQQLDDAPAAAGVGGVVGIIVLFLVIFVITDMLCATNVYSFVNCVN
ncbi:PA2779 family protein [uncultured Marinobacter sp.]|uniref:PA2779 family protein n=1 Tax=uncultured Marinobacter sp. TaxID=187379 RepID=UPI0030DAC19E